MSASNTVPVVVVAQANQPTAASPVLPLAVPDPAIKVLAEGVSAKISAGNSNSWLDLRKIFRNKTQDGQPVLAPGTNAQSFTFTKKGICLDTRTWRKILPQIQAMLDQEAKNNSMQNFVNSG